MNEWTPEMGVKNQYAGTLPDAEQEAERQRLHASRYEPVFSFPSKLSYWFREKVGELRLALRSWLGIDDAEASLSAIEGLLTQAIADIQALRKDLDADQLEYAENRAADAERLSTLEVNVQKVATQNAQIANGLNGVTMLALAWREVPILKRAEKEAQARRERQRAEKADRAADAVKNAPAPITDGALNDCR